MKLRMHIAGLFCCGIIPLAPCAAHAQQIAFSTGDLVFGGDFRYRHEQISQEGALQRDRDRIRARMNITAIVNPGVKFIFGLASGCANDPISSNQDMGAGFSDKPLWIDQAYFDWTTPVGGLNIQGGKVKNPFLAVGRNQMIWDHDLNPEGFSARFLRKSGETELFANGCLFWSEERPAGDDSFLLGAQAGIRRGIGAVNFTAGAGAFTVTNTKGSPTFFDTTKSFGNSVDANKNYLYEYREMEVFGEAAMSGKFPVCIMFDAVTNIAPDVRDNHAYMAGVSLGKTANKGSMAGRVYYLSVGRDAVIGAFSDSDFGGGGTDNKGAVFQYDIQAANNVTLNATFFMNRRGIKNGIDYHRLQLDTNFKF